MSVWFGLHLPSFTHPGTPPDQLFDRVIEQAKTADEAGFRMVTVMDHLYQIPGVGRIEEPMLESWLTLAALARETSRVRLGTLVTGITYRNPALLAKQATTLDVISGGRAIFGVGAAWNDVEHEGYGFDFPPIKERLDRLEEALQIAKGLFTEERATFHGTYSHIDQALNEPKPVQSGGLPILVGGGGEQRTLRIAAKYADMTHWFPLGMETLQRKTDLLRKYCDEVGRDPDTIERTMATPVMVATSDEAAAAALERVPPERRPYVAIGPPARAAELLRPYIDAGFTGFTFNNTLYRTPDEINQVGELLALVAG